MSAPWGASESASRRPLNQHRAPTRPEQASSGICPVVSGPQGAQPTGIPAGVETRFILARNGRSRCGERPHARNGRSRATRRAEAASGAGHHVHTCPTGRDTRRSSHRPGGLRKGEAASVVPRPRKHRRHEARSGGRGMPSGRGLSETVFQSSCFAFNSVRNWPAAVPIRTPSTLRISRSCVAVRKG